jgi:putative ABC transport system permease protein
MPFSEYIKLAWRSISSSLLRSILTLLVIGLGIGALIAIITSIQALENSMRTNFATMGTNTFTIVDQGQVFDGQRDVKTNEKINVHQAELFKQNFKLNAKIAIHAVVNGNSVLKFESKKTNPNVNVTAIDENYLSIAGLLIEEGRNFTTLEIENGVSVALVGEDVVSKLYPDRKKVLGSLLTIGSAKYKVIGVLKSKGSSSGSNDNLTLIGYTSARQNYDMKDVSYNISIFCDNAEDIDKTIEEASGVFRNIRKVRPGEEDHFEINKSDSNAEKLISILSNIKIATIVIGILTLIGAGIGLMNILLVSVNERTREIGVSKAIGATRRNIMMQFLSESVMICLLGGIAGIILGILFGNAVALGLHSSFIMPWNWVFYGLLFCTIIGLSAGIYPALKAGNLNPVEALRYE